MSELSNYNAFKIDLSKGASLETIKPQLKKWGCHYHDATKKWNCPISQKSFVCDLLDGKKIKAILEDCKDDYFDKSESWKKAENLYNRICYLDEKNLYEERLLVVDKELLNKEMGRRELTESDPSVEAKLSDFLEREMSLKRSKEEVDQLRNNARLLEKQDSEANEWFEPRPIIAELLPVMPFEAEKLLPPELREFVVDEAERMPTASDYVAATLIVVLGGVIGAQVAIKPKSRDSWTIVPNLWGGVVGLPSSKKSPAIDAAMKPLERLMTNERERHREMVLQYEGEEIVFEARKKSLEDSLKKTVKDPKKNSSTIAKELVEHKQNAPTPPIPRRFKTNDTTIEKCGELLRDNPRGMIVLRDELVGLLTSWDRNGHEGDRAFYLESWNGCSSYDTDRIKRGSIHIPNLCISLFGGIQPDKLTRYLDQAQNSLENDGLLQRFQVLVYPDRHPWEWRDRIPNEEARNNVYKIFQILGDAQFDPYAFGAHPTDDHNKFPFFHFDEEAQAIFIEWSSSLHRRLEAEEHPIIQQHLAKYDKLFPALSLIFHLVGCTAGRECGSIKASSAILASSWCEYLESHARRCYGLLVDDGLRAAQALSEKILEGKILDGFTIRDIRRNQWRYLTTDSPIGSALEWLEDEGWIKPYKSGGTGPGSGQPTIKYLVNPRISCQRVDGDRE